MTRRPGPRTGPNVGTQSSTSTAGVTQPAVPADTAELPNLAAVHARVRTLFDAAGIHTRPERAAFLAEVLGRDVRWPYGITGPESDQIIAALEAGISEPTHEVAP